MDFSIWESMRFTDLREDCFKSAEEGRFFKIQASKIEEENFCRPALSADNKVILPSAILCFSSQSAFLVPGFLTGYIIFCKSLYFAIQPKGDDDDDVKLPCGGAKKH